MRKGQKRTEKQKKARITEYRKIKRQRRVIPNSITTTIWVDKELWDEFQAMCKRQKFSASYVIWKIMRRKVQAERVKALKEDYWAEIKRKYEKKYGQTV